MSGRQTRIIVGLFMVMSGFVACGGPSSESEGVDEFVASLTRDGDGDLIFDGDLAFPNETAARDFYEERFGDGRSTQLANKRGAVWSDREKLALGYCVSNAFGGDKRRVLQAMQSAAAQWEQAANVKFHYLPQYDGQCANSRTRPRLFVPVRLNNECGWHASGAYPYKSSYHRLSFVKVNTRALGRCRQPVLFDLPGLLLHELGHVLGFIHEHDRRENAQNHDRGRCNPHNLENYNALTSYDPYSIMHYSECGGLGPYATGDPRNNTTMSSNDRAGAAARYGRRNAKGTQGPFFRDAGGTILLGKADGYCHIRNMTDFRKLTGQSSVHGVWQGLRKGRNRGACQVDGGQPPPQTAVPVPVGSFNQGYYGTYYLTVRNARNGIQGSTDNGPWTTLTSPWRPLNSTTWYYYVPSNFLNLPRCQTFAMRWKNLGGQPSSVLTVSCGKGRCRAGACTW